MAIEISPGSFISEDDDAFMKDLKALLDKYDVVLNPATENHCADFSSRTEEGIFIKIDELLAQRLST